MRLTSEQKQQFKTAWLRGDSYVVLRRVFGFGSDAAIHKLRKRMGLGPRTGKDAARTKLFMHLWYAGVHANVIARSLGYKSYHSVYSRACYLKLDRRAS